MQNSNRWVGVLVLVIVSFILGSYVGKTYLTKDLAIENYVSGNVSILIDSGDDNISRVELEIEGPTKLSDILTRLSSEKKIELKSKDYGGDMGLFIESINGVSAGASGEKWWQFWLNGNYSQVGVSSTTIDPGDNVLFKFTGSQQ